MKKIREDITLTLLGGGKEIGANCYLLQWGQSNILLDCGMNPTHAGYEALPELDLLMGVELDAVVITHAHLDHIGGLPFIANHYLGLGAKIFLTHPTADLLEPMLMESVKAVDRRIPEDRQYYYHEYASRNILEDLMNLLTPCKVNAEFNISGTGLTGTFFHAGHILGSAGIVISDGDYTLVYTGDICKDNQDILQGCELPQNIKVDCLMIESTLGSEDKKKAKREDAYERLTKEIKCVLKKSGYVLIPVFGLGRAQEIMTMLNRMKKNKEINKDTPVLVHKGVTEAVTRIYDKHVPLDGADNKLMDSVEFISAFKGDNAFKKAEEMAGQSGIFVFSSGMMIRGTPSARLAEELVAGDNNGIFFPGYTAPGELGYELLNTGVNDKICVDRYKNQWVNVKCSNIKKFSFSAHADSTDLIQVVESLNPSCVVWVHGDDQSATRLKNSSSDMCVSLAPVNRESVLLRKSQKKINRSFREFRGVIVTVGTSLIITYLKKKDRNFSEVDKVTKEELQEYIRQNIKDLPGLCAETNSLAKQQIFKNDFLYFISGDKGPGRICGEILAQLYGESNFCSFIPVKGLEPKAEIFEEKGMGNLIETLSFLIERHARKNIILATGGFKAQIALATELGILFRQKVYYLYENFASAVKLPELPVDFDFNSIAAHQHSFFRLLDAREYWLAENIYDTLPETLKFCFKKDDLQRRYTLTALGRAILIGYRNQSINTADIPVVVDDHSGLWGKQQENFRQIINPDIVTILKRVARHKAFITDFKFFTQKIPDISMRKENCLELSKQNSEKLIFIIHRLDSTKKKTEMLEINTPPMMAPTLLGFIGRRIYP